MGCQTYVQPTNPTPSGATSGAAEMVMTIGFYSDNACTKLQVRNDEAGPNPLVYDYYGSSMLACNYYAPSFYITATSIDSFSGVFNAYYDSACTQPIPSEMNEEDPFNECGADTNIDNSLVYAKAVIGPAKSGAGRSISHGHLFLIAAVLASLTLFLSRVH